MFKGLNSSGCLSPTSAGRGSITNFKQTLKWKTVSWMLIGNITGLNVSKSTCVLSQRDFYWMTWHLKHSVEEFTQNGDFKPGLFGLIGKLLTASWVIPGFYYTGVAHWGNNMGQRLTGDNAHPQNSCWSIARINTAMFFFSKVLRVLCKNIQRWGRLQEFKGQTRPTDIKTKPKRCFSSLSPSTEDQQVI